jgi:hypothetical protein
MLQENHVLFKMYYILIPKHHYFKSKFAKNVYCWCFCKIEYWFKVLCISKFKTCLSFIFIIYQYRIWHQMENSLKNIVYDVFNHHNSLIGKKWNFSNRIVCHFVMSNKRIWIKIKFKLTLNLTSIQHLNF